jgi:hypothetical protein
LNTPLTPIEQLWNRLNKDGFDISQKPCHVRAWKRGTITIIDMKCFDRNARYLGGHVHYNFNTRTGKTNRIVPWNYTKDHLLNKHKFITRPIRVLDQTVWRREFAGYEWDKGMSLVDMINKYYYLMLHYRTYVTK